MIETKKMEDIFVNYMSNTIPTVFDDKLSYYETLQLLINYIKETITKLNNNADAVTELQGLYVELQQYVDDYFTNLDIQTEINAKLDTMVTDGTLATIINENIFNELNADIEQFKTDTNTAIATFESEVNADIDPINERLDIIENNYNIINIIRDYNASGSAEQTTGSINSGSNTLTLANAIDFKNGQGISIQGAGNSGNLLITKIISGAGTNTLTLENEAETTVTLANVFHDDTNAIQSAINYITSNNRSRKTLFLPSGIYITTSVISCTKKGYGAIKIIGEGFAGNVQYGGYIGTLIQSRVQAATGYKSGSVPAIDLTGSQDIIIENLRIDDSGNVPNSLTSIGIMVGTTSDGWNAQHHNYKNLQIRINSKGSGYNTSSDSNFNYLGSIGIYNYGAELFGIENCIIDADTPIVFSASNICSVTCPDSPSTANPGTMSQIVVDKNTDLISRGNTGMGAGFKGCAIILDNAHDIKINAYWYLNSTNQGYMIQIKGNCYHMVLDVNIECDTNVAHLIKAYGSVYNLINWDIIASVFGNASYPLIDVGTESVRRSSIKASTTYSPEDQKLFNTETWIASSLIYLDPNQVLGGTNNPSALCTILQG